MLSSVIANREWRPLVRPASLIRPDRVRRIDRIIDYFGGAHRRTAPLAPSHPRFLPGRDDRQMTAARR